MRLQAAAATVAFLAGLLAGCQSADTQTGGGAGSSTARPRQALLSVEEAQRRRARISEPSYHLQLQLDENSPEYAGSVLMRFADSKPDQPLTIDFGGGEITRMEINSQPATAVYQGNFIQIPAHTLAPGVNEIDISYRRPYARDGQGLYRFTDPVDERVYIYSDFEPYAANRLFPHFDQPDLKADFTLTVDAPAEWQVVSSTREQRIEEHPGTRRWYFPATRPISSYYFSLYAGPWAVWEDPGFRYPLRLFARQSIRHEVSPELWLDYTRRGFDYFENYFDFDYPFSKYDQLLVPDYNQGAMENVAAVSYSERFTSRSELTYHDRQSLAGVIYHEMAHMWFGDISTMAWWNGLWLNESFASIMSYKAVQAQPEFDDAWHKFFLGYKQWAYYEDELVTTHPIEVPVLSTAHAETMFDGITYGKGAAVLRQLEFYLGEDRFRDGVRGYLTANAYANTELVDFTGALASSSGKDMTEWAREWLFTAGLNRVAVEKRCRRGALQSLVLVQTAPAENPTLRTHRLELGLFDQANGGLQPGKSVTVTLAGARTPVPAVIGEPCPALAYPNVGDRGYIKVILDDSAVNTVRHHINTLTDPLQRSLIWADLWGMTEEARLSLAEYLQILNANLAGEHNENVLIALLRTLRSAFDTLHMIAGGDEVLERYARHFETVLWQGVADSTGDTRRIWLDYYIATANNKRAWQQLISMLKGETSIADLSLDQDQRWDVIVRLRQFGVDGSKTLLEEERTDDPSSRGQDRALQATVIGATAAEKVTWRERAVSSDENYQLQQSRTILHSLYPASQRYLAEEYAERMLSQLPELDRNQDVLFHREVGTALIPRLCTSRNLARLTQARADYPGLNPVLIRYLRIAIQQEQRCIAMAQALAADSR